MVCRLARFWLISRDLRLDDLDAGLIGAFLEHLRSGRHNGARTRNARLTAIHSLLRYAALRHPEHAALIQRVLAIPPARFGKTVVSFLTRGEAEALLAAPDRSRWVGRRDHALLAVALQTGLGGGQAAPLSPASRGQPLSRDAVELLVARHARTAQAACPTLAAKTVSPHVLRHTAAMSLLHAGNDITVIALWLGHERAETAQIYIHADQTLKQRALDRTTPPGIRPGPLPPA